MIRFGRNLLALARDGAALSLNHKGAYARPVNIVAPAILGATTTVGSVMTIDPGQWTGGGSFLTYWYIDGHSVGTNGPSYTVLAGDTGKTLTATVGMTNSKGGASAQAPGRLL